MCLNQNICYKQLLINQFKSDINQLRDQLKSVLSPDIYSSVTNMFTNNNHHTKHLSKNRLYIKFNWRIYKYYSHEWSNWNSFNPNHRYTVTHNPLYPWFKSTDTNSQDVILPQTDQIIIQNADDKVTCINLVEDNLTEAEQSLLALGPGFAVSPNFN